mmetsp:Transcript_91633/g.143826  ORF Transcript_91633/g.143826 Transcript_91633/m.143826 type:complete len:204 (-) Transcript_91633:355-966(-)
MGCCLRKNQHETVDKDAVSGMPPSQKTLEEQAPQGATVEAEYDEDSAAARLAKQRAEKDAKRRLIASTSYERTDDCEDEPLSPKTKSSVGAKMAARRASKDKFGIARRVGAQSGENEKLEKLLDDAGVKGVRTASKRSSGSARSGKSDEKMKTAQAENTESDKIDEEVKAAQAESTEQESPGKRTDVSDMTVESVSELPSHVP